MSTAQYIRPSGPSHDSEAVRLGGATADAAGRLTDADIYKLVKFAGTDRYDLCVAGDIIEGAITSVDPATAQGFAIGGVNKFDKMTVIADGLQATPGTGVIAAGDFVVCGTPVAKGTRLGNTFAKVCKATVQPGTTPADLAAAGVQLNMLAKGAWRVVSLLESATGVVGTKLTIERVGVPGVAR